jgi:hypothetical protein
LVVPGDRDATCLPEASARIAKEVAAAQLVPLAPAKHMGLIEHYEQFGALVRDFAFDCFRRKPAHQPVERTV